MPKVLITGASGFTGKHLTTELIRNGYDIVSTGLDKNDISNRNYYCDITNYENIANVLSLTCPDYVIHLAGLSHVKNDLKKLFEVNLFGTETLLQACYAIIPNVKKIILASSANIYGNTSIEMISESVCPSPQNDYANSKLAMEHMAALWFKKLPITLVRPFNYTGLGQHVSFLVPKIVSHFKSGQEQIKLGNLDVYRDFSDVRDVCRSYRLLLDAESQGQKINVCSGQLYSIADILGLCSNIARYKIKVTLEQGFIRENEVKKLCGDKSRLDSLIGRTSNFNLRDTLAWMLDDN